MSTPDHVSFAKIGKSFSKAFHTLTDGKSGTVQYVGFVKLHGTNAAVGRTKDGDMYYQSRNRIITPQDDNCGFAQAMSQFPWESFLQPGDLLFGEWAGKGVQRKVAISELEKEFYPFIGYRNGGYVDPYYMIPRSSPGELVDPYARLEFSTTNLEATGRIINELTLEVEETCPVAFNHGVKGIGEGLVWRPDPGVYGAVAFNPETWFKSKGVQHEVKERIPSTKTFDDHTATDAFLVPCIEHRGSQGLDFLREMFGAVEAKHTGDFIKWMMADITAEEDIPDEVNMKRAGMLAARWFKAHGVK